MTEMNDKYTKRNPFAVPDGYWDTLSDRVMRRVEAEELPAPAGWRQLLRPYIGFAATFLIVLGVVYFLVSSSGEVSRGTEVAEYSRWDDELPGEEIFDSEFNPTTEEIIEYLAVAMDNYELMLASVYED